MASPLSAGDIITVVGLIQTVSKALRDTKGARANFKEVLHELDSLEDALNQAKDAIPEGERQRRDMRRVLRRCESTIKDFTSQIGKYQSSLQAGGSGNAIRDTVRKIQWSLSKPEEVAAFRDLLRTHLTSLQIILQAATQ